MRGVYHASKYLRNFCVKSYRYQVWRTHFTKNMISFCQINIQFKCIWYTSELRSLNYAYITSNWQLTDEFHFFQQIYYLFMTSHQNVNWDHISCNIHLKVISFLFVAPFPSCSMCVLAWLLQLNQFWLWFIQLTSTYWDVELTSSFGVQ